MFAGESYHFGQPSHGAVFVGEFAQDGAGWQSREFCQIDTSFGVPSAFEYAAGYYIFKKMKNKEDLVISTIAKGISIGNDLEYTDELTLGRSIVNRVKFSFND